MKRFTLLALALAPLACQAVQLNDDFSLHKLVMDSIKPRPTTPDNRTDEQSSDPELVALGRQMARDISGVPEERALPLLALAIGAAVAAMVGGVTVGRATYEATHPKKQ